MVAVKREAVLEFAGNMINGKWQWMRFDIGDLLGQWPRGERLVDRHGTKLQHGSDREHHGNQRDEAQHAQTIPAHEGKRNSTTEYKCDGESDEHRLAARQTMLRHQICNQQRWNNWSRGAQRMENYEPDGRSIVVKVLQMML